MSHDDLQPITARKLPNGTPCPALGYSVHGEMAELKFSSPVGFVLGDLVEMETPDSIYLGEVQRLTGISVVVGIEHFLPKPELDQISRRWTDSSRA